MSEDAFFSFETGQATDVGCCREVNEDRLLAAPERGLWLVADGMGGHAAGDFAAGAIVDAVDALAPAASADELHAGVMERLAEANGHILDHAAALGQGSIGSTVVALLVHRGDFACLWSGDSRAYLGRGGALRQLSRDHTEVRALVEDGVLSAEEARHWPRRNVITRAIGVSETPECDVEHGRLRPGDVFLLCSDGLTEHVTDAEIAERLASGAPAQALCDALVALTLERGAVDNVTVVVARCRAAGGQP